MAKEGCIKLQTFSSKGFFAVLSKWLEHLFNMCLTYINRYILEIRRLWWSGAEMEEKMVNNPNAVMEQLLTVFQIRGIMDIQILEDSVF